MTRTLPRKAIARAHQRLYDRIPPFDAPCLDGCSDCCGPVPWSAWEWGLVPEELAAVKAETAQCPYACSPGCRIYDVRPLMCRLYGTVEGLECPHGCGPAELLDEAEGRSIIAAYVRAMRLAEVRG